MLDRSYILNLLFEIHCTQAEVARMEKINGMLLEMTNRTYHRTVDMMRALMVMKKDDLDDDFELEGKLAPRFDIPYSVLRLEDDDYYGSDFIRIILFCKSNFYLLPLQKRNNYESDIF